MEENLIVIRNPKTVFVNFDWSEDLDGNMKHEIEFNIKRN